jgi:hypothetical protein
MTQLSQSLILGFLLTLICVPPLHAQTATSALATATDTVAANPTLAGQAPDEATKKITGLVHAGKYAEAQQLTAGLLIAYPNDQRLIKAKAVIDGLLSSASQGNAIPGNTHPVQPVATANAIPLTGMDKVEYNSLIELARQAQQTTDLEQQKTLLQQFMDQSGVFLQKHPDQTLLWQLRAASALSVDDLMAGCEAGQKLLAAGAADSSDPNLQQLLSKLNLKGWLGAAGAEKARTQAELTKQYSWMLGTWSGTYTDANWTHCAWWKGKCVQMKRGSTQYNTNEEVHFPKSAPVIEIYTVGNADVSPSSSGFKNEGPSYRGTLLDSGEIRWEFAHRTWEDSGWSPWAWIPVISCEVDEHEKTMTMVILSWNNDRDKNASHPETHFFTKSHGTH